MNITRVKRFLSKFGFCSPLNQLVYTNDEIYKMKKDGILFDAKYKSNHNGRVNGKNRTFEERLKFMKKGISLTNGKVVLNKRFKTEQETIEWRDWNYGEKGKWSWEVIIIN